MSESIYSTMKTMYTTTTMTVDEAIQLAKVNVKDPYAQAYLNAIPESFEVAVQMGRSAIDGLKSQLLYAVCNMQSWRGLEAREAKKVIKKYANS